MDDNFENQELSADERERLAALRKSPLPPPALEARVVAALRNERLLVTPNRWLKPLALAAAGILLFVLGWTSARWHFAPPREIAQQRFAFFLEKGNEIPAINSDQEKSLASEYARWGRQFNSAGERLANSGADLQTVAGPEIPWTSQPSSLRGFFIVSAKDLPDAIQIARTCPHLKYGGRIEVRPIDTPR